MTDLRNRLLSLAFLLPLLLAACGSDQAESNLDDASDSATAAEPADADTTEPANAESEADEESGTEEASADQSDDQTDDQLGEEAGDSTDDGRTIVALDEQAAYALLSLDVRPDVVLTTLSSETFARLNEQLGIEAIDFVIADPSFEVLAGLEPDLFVSIGSPWVVDRLAEYEQIAPVVLAPVDRTWQEQLTTFAAELAVDARADAVIGAVDDYQAVTAAALAEAGADGTTVSVLTARVGNLVAVNSGGATGELLIEVGLDRPAPQLSEGAPGIPFDFISEEVLPEHNADVLLLPSAAIFDITPLTSSAIYEQLPVVEAGGAHEVVADAWVLGGHGFATFWLLQDLRDLLVDDGVPATLDQTEDRWMTFLGLIG
ncbi:MAG: ABC transporter substrate-binding protein [Actinomycetota bacterium]